MSKAVNAVIALILAVAVADRLRAGQYNTVLDIGDQAPAWSGLQGTDGEKHSLEDLEKAKSVVVVFTCNSCPYARDVEGRLNELTRQFADQGVAVVAINVNQVEEDRLPAMKERAEEQGLQYAYLWDPSQQIAKAYGAKFTPQFFVLNEEREVVYMGAFDNDPAGENVTQTHVRDAVQAVLSGEEVEVNETVPIGCLIRFERELRRRRR